MRIHFIGANLEENLGMGVVAAVAEQAGHTARVVPFNDAAEIDRVVAQALEGAPQVIGLSMQFQHRALEFLTLSRRLREAGFRGHITAGGQFPTLAWREALDPVHGLDSVVLHDAEETLPELLAAVEAGGALSAVPGLALRGPEGPMRTAARRLIDDLDRVPFPKRYRRHDTHLGVPFIPVMGGRGCWGHCTYCSITAFYDDAIEHGGGGRAVRMRSPENVAAEMALLLESAGGRGIFCFHDDNFIFPSEKLSRTRVRAIREALDAYDVGEVALVGKARPDCVTPALAKELADLGVIRLYVGVENGSESGGKHLGRGKQQAHVSEALAACREAGIFVCYNLLIFEPEATLADVRENIRFIREHADHPVNFCRAEPYFGTSLHTALSAKQDLGGTYLGFNYRIADDRAELLFRVCSAAFRERNFAANGVANRAMGLGYAAAVLRRFHDRDGNTAALVRRARELTRAISLDTAGSLEKALALAERFDLHDFDAVERGTALLGLEIAAADRHWHEELDEAYAAMRAFSQDRAARAPAVARPSPKFLTLKNSSVAAGLTLAVTLAGCDGCNSVTVVDPVPDGGYGGVGTGGFTVVDPPPPDAGSGGWMVDPAPVDAGTGGTGGWMVDPAPVDAGTGGAGGWIVDPPPPDGGMGALDPQIRRLPLIDKWSDTAPTDTLRTADLPLYEPPQMKLAARREGDYVVVTLEGLTALVSMRWEGDGPIEGVGPEVRWRPTGPADRVRVAVRSRGGVAVLSLRAEETGLSV